MAIYLICAGVLLCYILGFFGLRNNELTTDDDPMCLGMAFVLAPILVPIALVVWFIYLLGLSIKKKK